MTIGRKTAGIWKPASVTVGPSVGGEPVGGRHARDPEGDAREEADGVVREPLVDEAALGDGSAVDWGGTGPDALRHLPLLPLDAA